MAPASIRVPGSAQHRLIWSLWGSAVSIVLARSLAFDTSSLFRADVRVCTLARFGRLELGGIVYHLLIFALALAVALLYLWENR